MQASTVDGEKYSVVTGGKSCPSRGPFTCLGCTCDAADGVRQAGYHMLVFSGLFDFRLRFHRSLHLCSALTHALRSDTPPYVLALAAVEALPTSSIPMPTFTTELSLTLLDGFTLAILLCTLIPPAVQSSSAPELAQPP